MGSQCKFYAELTKTIPNYLQILLITGLEKSSVLPVLDRFLSLKTDFVLNRKQKNRSIKFHFFPVQF